MASIKDSVLIKSIKSNPVITKKELLKQLSIVKKASGWNMPFRQSCLSQCFVWSNTPQGHTYWANIHSQLIMGGYYTKEL